MEILMESLRADAHALWQMAPRAILGLLVFLALVWIGRALGRAAARLARRGGRTPAHERFLRQIVGGVVGLIGLALALQIAGLGKVAAGMLAAGGVVAIVVGFAFREIGENLLSGLFLSFSRSFELGDMIQSGDWTGVVRGIDLRQVHVRTADGRDIFIPCRHIYGEPLVNFTRDGLRRPSFTVGIDYADDAGAARELLRRTVGQAPGVLEEPAASAVVSALAPSYVELQVSFWSDTFQQGVDLAAVQSDVMERCRRALREAGFSLSCDVTTALDVRAVPELAVRTGPPAAA